jgi:hypothetical protein
MLANRGQEIFVEASLRQEKQEESVFNRLLAVLQLWEDLELRRFWQTEALTRSREGTDSGSTCWRV